MGYILWIFGWTVIHHNIYLLYRYHHRRRFSSAEIVRLVDSRINTVRYLRNLQYNGISNWTSRLNKFPNNSFWCDHHKTQHTYHTQVNQAPTNNCNYDNAWSCLQSTSNGSFQPTSKVVSIDYSVRPVYRTPQNDCRVFILARSNRWNSIFSKFHLIHGS